ncbi:MAG: coproporphyrinogen III oxidase family protein [Candidatus Omnitrophica bacterium]|nr:coproporphyrinogen III oxidase family protein [Candidatus Omnitrophota bacterium]
MSVDGTFDSKIDYYKKHEHDSLVQKACSVLSSLQIPSLYAEGIQRNRIHYEIFNQYPAYSLLSNISEEKVFSHRHYPHSPHKEQKQSIALYLHLPFCLKKCTFCCFFSTTDWQSADIDIYLKYLEREMALVSQKPSMRGREISSLYWGGGTPMVLDTVHIDRLMKMLHNSFSMRSNAECICEATPETISEKKIECFLKNGFNRLSIGIQTFNDELLRSYNRLYSRAEVIESFNKSKKTGFSHINIDLMFGLAGQTLQTWRESLEIVAHLQPQNITFYPFSDSFNKTVMSQNAETVFPTEEEKLLMHVMAIEKMVEMGYIQISPYQFIVSWKFPYAHQEFKAINGEVYALGVTGHSFLNNCDYHNHHSLKNYQKSLEQNILPIKCGRALNKKEVMVRYIIYGLQKTSGINRRYSGVNKKVFQERFGVSIDYEFHKELKHLKQLKLLVDTTDTIRLSYQGLLYATETSLFFYSEEDRKKINRLNLSADLK